MKKKTRSILEELSSLGNSRNTELLIENKGSNIIESAVNLLTLVKEHYSAEEADEIERRFLNAIRNNDGRKFKRSLAKINESRKNSQNSPLSE